MSASSKSDLLLILAGNYADFFGGVLSANRLVQLGQYVSAILNILHRLRYQSLAPEAASKTSPLAGHIVPKMKYH
jgi:hypothetical protein